MNKKILHKSKSFFTHLSQVSFLSVYTFTDYKKTTQKQESKILHNEHTFFPGFFI